MLGTASRVWLAAVAALMLAGPAVAQINVDIQFPQNNFLLYEPIKAELVIQNELGGSIILRPGGKLFTIDVEIRSHRNNRAAPTGRPYVTELHTVNPMETARIPIDLLDTHHVRYPGTYGVVASISYRGQTFSSKKHFLDISKGTVIRELRTFEPPRLFSLRTSHRNGVQTLMVRVDDAQDKEHFGVYTLGRLLQSSEPQVALEAGSIVHILHRLTPRQYMHSTFSAGGVPLEQKVLNSTVSRQPVLGKGPDGTIAVSGAQSGPLGQESLDLDDIGIGIPSSLPAGHPEALTAGEAAAADWAGSLRDVRCRRAG